MTTSDNIIFTKISLEIFKHVGFADYSKIAVLMDDNTFKHCYPLVKSSLPEHLNIVIPSGEKHKNLDTCQQIWLKLIENYFDRNSVLINLGGGVITDMGGFCAASFLRGINFINVPTTLLAMVDASYGGKTGVNFNNVKNIIGQFQEPYKTIIDISFLNTLNERHLVNGYAEILKHQLISNEMPFFSSELLFSENEVENSILIKKKIVERDFKESGERKFLNFGHTIGHGIESVFMDDEIILHGEAVLVGMICELFLSTQISGFDEVKLNQVAQHILSIYKFKKITEDEMQKIADLTLFDKKNESTSVRCVLLKDFGKPLINQPISKEQILQSLMFYNSLLDRK